MTHPSATHPSAADTLPAAPIVTDWDRNLGEILGATEPVRYCPPVTMPWQPTSLAGHLASDLVQSTIEGRTVRVRVLRVALDLALKLRRAFA